MDQLAPIKITFKETNKVTNFIYRIKGASLSDNDIADINSIDTHSKIKDRIRAIEQKGASLNFHKLESSTFRNNLILIDSSLPTLISEMLYLFFTSEYTKTIDLVDQITLLNPLKYDLSLNHPFYSYKIKRFLTDIALGMMPSKVWTGELDATGGHLIVKEDGDILCYHIYHRNEFEDYLLNNTKFETASSTRHDFGSIYKDGADTLLKLNLQIRFLK